MILFSLPLVVAKQESVDNGIKIGKPLLSAITCGEVAARQYRGQHVRGPPIEAERKGKAMATAWMVRAGKGACFVEDFVSGNCVAVGWQELSDLSSVKSKDELRKLVEEAYPEDKPGQRQSWITQMGAFLLDMKVGDPVVTYDSDSREYLVGEVIGGYEYKSGVVTDSSHLRAVKWETRVRRDDLSVQTRNTLGAIMTVFRLGEAAWDEVSGLRHGKKPQAPPEEEQDELEQIREDLLGRSHEFIKDRIQELDWQDIQELVAGILRAMGYKTLVSAPGSDLGKDIVASPDGLGLEQPRIRVEVKHRTGQRMGAPEIRSFLGALRQNDRGLYVSSGGFSKEAHYEAERAQVPVTLLDLDAIGALLVQHYDELDPETRSLVPLIRVYWPVS